MSTVVSMKQLLEAGVHFGHQTRRWNPKMAPYIFTERNGIYIIDLQKTVKKLEEAYMFVRDVAANGDSLLFVGTKKQASDAIREEAERAGMYYVNARWLGGMLTNFKTIRARIDRLNQLNKMDFVSVWSNVVRLAGSAADVCESANDLLDSQKGRINDTLQNFDSAVSSLRTFAETISENPSLLLRPRDAEPLPETK